MLKKILSQSSLEISLKSGNAILTPSKTADIVLHFENNTEYDMPLSVNIALPIGVNVDTALFDITVPALGNTQKTLVFDVKSDALMFFGQGVVEISAFDRVLENRDVFELNLLCEMSYKCDGESLFSRNGVFYINTGETLEIQFAPMEQKDVSLCVLSGNLLSIKLNSMPVENISKITLQRGVNKFFVTSKKEASFCFTDINTDTGAFINTINSKNFAEEE